MTGCRTFGLLKNSAGVTLARIVGSAAAFATQFLLARLMAPADLGVFYIVTSMAIVLGTVAALGYPGIANRLVVRYARRDKRSTRSAFVRTARRDSFMVAFCILASTLVVIGTGMVGGPEHVWPAAIAAFAIPAFTMLRVNGGLANAVHRFALSFLPDNLIRPVLFFLALGGLAVFTGSLGLVPVLGLFSALAIIVAAIQTCVVGWYGQSGDRATSADRRQTRLWRRSGLSLVTPLLITTLFADVVIMTSSVALEVQQVAIFGLCTKIAFLFGFFVQVAHQIATPRFAEALQARRPDDLDITMVGTNAMAVAAMTLALVAVCIFGEELLALFGAGFRAGSSVLAILTGAQLVRALGGPAMPLLVASGRHARGMPVMVGSLAVLGAALLLLAPPLGVTGAALAVLAASVVASGWLAFVARQELDISCDALSCMGNLFQAVRPLAWRIS